MAKMTIETKRRVTRIRANLTAKKRAIDYPPSAYGAG
jgi:hypothetical protein